MGKAEQKFALMFLTILIASAILTTEQEAKWLLLGLWTALFVSVLFNYELWWYVVELFAGVAIDLATSWFEKIKKQSVRRIIMALLAGFGVWLILKSVNLISTTVQLWWLPALVGFVLLGLLLSVIQRLRKL